MFDMIPEMQGTAALSPRQTAAIQTVADELARLNAAIREAVNAGLSVELSRSERYHCGSGCWGDVMRPVIVRCL